MLDPLNTIRLVIAWTCVAIFIVSALITILALMGVIRLPNPKYLNRLFTVIIVAVVATCASFFQDFIHGPDHNGADTNQVVKPFPPIDTPPAPNSNLSQAATHTTKPAPEKGWIGFKHSGIYVAKFYLNWKVGDQSKSWSSGKQAVGYLDKIELDGNAHDIIVTAQVDTGLGWHNIFKERLDQPPNKYFMVKGTTLSTSWAKVDK